MTLTAMLPTLRHSLPDPLDPDAWPPGTTALLDDLIVGGVSLLREARRSGVPLVYGDGDRAVAVGWVIARADDPDDGVDLVADVPGDLAYTWAEARLIGRISVAPAGSVRLSSAIRRQRAATVLPRDLAVGDLLVIPFVRR